MSEKYETNLDESTCNLCLLENSLELIPCTFLVLVINLVHQMILEKIKDSNIILRLTNGFCLFLLKCICYFLGCLRGFPDVGLLFFAVFNVPAFYALVYLEYMQIISIYS